MSQQHDRAVAEYEASLAEDPADHRALLGLVYAFVEMKRYPDAIMACERLAEVWRRRRSYNRAVFYYVSAYAFLRRHVPHLEERFGHLPSRLAETFAEVIAEDPQSAEQNGRFTQEALATRAGREDTEQALIELLRKVIEIDSNNPLPRLCLVDALVRAGEDATASPPR